jgi:hypothetical protein
LSWQSHESWCHCKIHKKGYRRKKRRLGSYLTSGGRLRVNSFQSFIQVLFRYLDHLDSLEERHATDWWAGLGCRFCGCLLASCHRTCMTYRLPDAVCTVLDFWWWTERQSETCRVFQNKINLRYCASGWFSYRSAYWIAKFGSNSPHMLWKWNDCFLNWPLGGFVLYWQAFLLHIPVQHSYCYDWSIFICTTYRHLA